MTRKLLIIALTSITAATSVAVGSLAPVPTAAAATNPCAGTIGDACYRKIENEILRLINARRRRMANTPVNRNHAYIKSQARAHSRQMKNTCRNPGAAKCQEGHDGFDGRRNRIAARGFVFNSICENEAGYGTAPAKDRNWRRIARSAYNGWLNSQGHKVCMLSQPPWPNTNRAGVGVVLGRRNIGGTTFWWWWMTFIAGRTS